MRSTRGKAAATPQKATGFSERTSESPEIARLQNSGDKGAGALHQSAKRELNSQEDDDESGDYDSQIPAKRLRQQQDCPNPRPPSESKHGGNVMEIHNPGIFFDVESDTTRRTRYRIRSYMDRPEKANLIKEMARAELAKLTRRYEMGEEGKESLKERWGRIRLESKRLLESIGAPEKQAVIPHAEPESHAQGENLLQEPSLAAEHDQMPDEAPCFKSLKAAHDEMWNLQQDLAGILTGFGLTKLPLTGYHNAPPSYFGFSDHSWTRWPKYKGKGIEEFLWSELGGNTFLEMRDLWIRFETVRRGISELIKKMEGPPRRPRMGHTERMEEVDKRKRKREMNVERMWTVHSDVDSDEENFLEVPEVLPLQGRRQLQKQFFANFQHVDQDPRKPIVLRDRKNPRRTDGPPSSVPNTVTSSKSQPDDIIEPADDQ